MTHQTKLPTAKAEVAEKSEGGLSRPDECPEFEVERTSVNAVRTAANDPTRTFYV
jgi:hypothetical protein